MSRRRSCVALLLAAAVAAGTTAPAEGRPLLALRPGPTESPLHAVAADFDRDGLVDLAVANFQSGTVALLLNRGGGAFDSHPDSAFEVGRATFSAPTSGPLHLQAVDLNRDDVDSDGVDNATDTCPNVANPRVCSNNHAVACTSSASCSSGGTCGQIDENTNGVGDACETSGGADMDGDGVLDYDATLAGGANPTAALDNCPRRANPRVCAAAPGVTCTTAADCPVPTDTCAQADGDSDRVGDPCETSPDLLVLGTSLGGGSIFGIVRVRLNDGAGGLMSRPSKAAGSGASEIAVADFTGDGFADIVVSNSGADALLFFPGAADGQFGNGIAITTGDGPEGMAVADFDDDGDTDLAVANRSAATVGVYLNAGTALPTTASASFNTAAAPTTLLAGRLDPDAYPDLVVLAQGTAGQVQVFPGGAAGFASMPSFSQPLAAGELPRRGALEDLDGDGDLDLAIALFSPAGGATLTLAGVGDGTFAAPCLLPDTVRSPAAVATIDYDDSGDPDLAVLGFADNRLEILRNNGSLDCAGSSYFTVDPASPVSPWKRGEALAVFAADASLANDIALVQRADPATQSPASIETLSGLGTNGFVPLPRIPLERTLDVSAAAVGDILQDGAHDLVLADPVGDQVTVITAEVTGDLIERRGAEVGGAVSSVNVGTLIADVDDYDRDGVLNADDNCPTRFNPPGCKADDEVNFPECFSPPACPSSVLTDCNVTDPTTGQCDSDGNGVGDHCQVVAEITCGVRDSDFDGIPDYDLTFAPATDPFSEALDNCPFVPNSAKTCSNALATSCTSNAVCPAGGVCRQPDQDDDRIGDACDGGACGTSMTCTSGPRINGFCETNADCDPPIGDVVAVRPGEGEVDLLIGDGTGTLRAAAASPLGGLTAPSAAVPAAGLSLSCQTILSLDCRDEPLGTTDVVVLDRGVVGNLSDDTLVHYAGDGLGGFVMAGTLAMQGDATEILAAEAQPVCARPYTTGPDPGVRFDNDLATTLLAVVQPGTSSIAIVLPRGTANGPGSLGPPLARPEPLPVHGPPADAIFVDINRDDVMDVAVLSAGDGDPGTPNVMLYIGIGNGLFFTDPSLNPAGVPDGATRIAAGNLNLRTDSTFPEIVVYRPAAGSMTMLTNILPERADIDESGRVDGYDLALLSRAFGSVRGEDFTILGPADGALDGTLAQTGTGPTRTVTGTGTAAAGRDLTVPRTASQTSSCNQTFDPLTGAYGLPVDINLDGKVDGEDLAFIASRFGRRF